VRAQADSKCLWQMLSDQYGCRSVSEPGQQLPLRQLCIGLLSLRQLLRQLGRPSNFMIICILLFQVHTCPQSGKKLSLVCCRDFWEEVV
jgi:hypothetical protein